FVAVARPALPITGPVIIAVGIGVWRACNGGRRSDRTGGYAGRKPDGAGSVMHARPVVHARAVVAMVVAIVIAAWRTHAVSAAQIVGVRVVEPDHAGLLGRFLRHRRRRK